MRISPAGYAAQTEDEAIRLSESITRVTHNHQEGIKGAEATAVAIFMARRGSTRKKISDKISDKIIGSHNGWSTHAPVYKAHTLWEQLELPYNSSCSR